MATRRTTFDKLQRERAKRAKAAAKRERRQERAAEGPEEAPGTELPREDLTPGEIMQRLDALHERYEAKQIDFESFEDQKRELLERLAALPID
jgi:hypothetical protein